MASKKEKSVVNVTLLSAINEGARVGKNPETVALLNHNPPLITVDAKDLDASGNAKAWLTDAGRAALPKSNGAKQDAARSETPQYAIIPNAIFVAAEKKRGGRGGGAPVIYPWATMEVGSTFFVGISQKENPFKSMQSAVSSANMKYSEEVGEPKERVRTKRGPGNRAVVDANGDQVKETVMKRDRQQLRKFDLRQVKKGDKFGEWNAPENGVLVGRVM